jgi:hypothetical protein
VPSLSLPKQLPFVNPFAPWYLYDRQLLTFLYYETILQVVIYVSSSIKNAKDITFFGFAPVSQDDGHPVDGRSVLSFTFKMLLLLPPQDTLALVVNLPLLDTRQY